jgi:hypothetical protein
MLHSSEQRHSLEQLAGQLAQEGLCHRPQLLLAIWEATQKAVLAHSSQGRPTLLAGSFVSWANCEAGRYWFALEPTDSTLRECQLKARVPSPLASPSPATSNT